MYVQYQVKHRLYTVDSYMGGRMYVRTNDFCHNQNA